MDGFERGARVECPVGQNDGRAGVHCAHGPDHAAVAVEQRHRHNDLVLLGIVKSLREKLSVVHNVVVRQHHALGQACCPAGVLDVGHVVHGHLRGQLARRVFQRQPLRRVEVDGMLQLQAEPVPCTVENLFVVGPFIAMPKEQCLHARTRERELQLVRAVGGVHVHQRRAGPRAPHVHHDPLDAVGRPQPHAVAAPNAQRPQAAGHRVGLIAQLGPAHPLALVARCHGQPVAEALRRPAQKVADGQLQQRPAWAARVAQGAKVFLHCHGSAFGNNEWQCTPLDRAPMCDPAHKTSGNRPGNAELLSQAPARQDGEAIRNDRLHTVTAAGHPAHRAGVVALPAIDRAPMLERAGKGPSTPTAVHSHSSRSPPFVFTPGVRQSRCSTHQTIGHFHLDRSHKWHLKSGS